MAFISNFIEEMYLLLTAVWLGFVWCWYLYNGRAGRFDELAFKVSLFLWVLFLLKVVFYWAGKESA